MSDAIDPFDQLADEEKELLRAKVRSGAAPRKGGIPGTLKNSIDGLRRLRPDEVPVPGRHYVVWGSHHLSDIRARPVKRALPYSEDEHAEKEVAHTQALLSLGLKNPKVWSDPQTGAPGIEPDKVTGAVEDDRLARAERYARWRYRGYLAGEVVSL